MKKKNLIITTAILAAIAILGIVLLHNRLAPAPNSTTDTDTPIVTTTDRPTNFEGKVAETAVGSITLDDARVVKITDSTTVTTPSGDDSIIFPGNYIQGYADDAEGDEIVAEYIIITALG